METSVLAVSWLGVLAVVVWLSLRGAWVGAVLALVVLAFISLLVWRSVRTRRRPASGTPSASS